MKKLMITAVCAFAAVVLPAQDMSAQTAVQKAGGCDDGAKAVALAVDLVRELNAPSPREKFVPASEEVQRRVEKFREKLRKQKKLKGVRIGIGTACWTFEDPSRDHSEFTEIRSMKAVEAYLAAKANVIRSIKESLNASLTSNGGDNEVDDHITERKLNSESEMQLRGATVIAQAESWDELTKEYQMSIAILWSESLARGAVSIIEDNSKVRESGACSIDEWADNCDLRVMVGPRTFIDDDGHKIFVGIGTADIECPASLKERRRHFATREAKAAIAVALESEALAFDMTEYSSSLGTSASISRLAKALRAGSIHQALTGCAELRSMEVVHPISQRKIYVSMYYIQEKSKEAKTILEEAKVESMCWQATANRAEKSVQSACMAGSIEFHDVEDDLDGETKDEKRSIRSKDSKTKSGDAAEGAIEPGAIKADKGEEFF